ncbi:hypothetical protein SAMN05660662_0778 [Blastococcus aurantiacus]|uniref:Uncharacterized protein n=1 Tax=Blastococcus aurantiacus TaxID=1550231 RepID=A0A1G7HRR9_9ACTN|nr:hypothetical protein SAMN05660662_0778 [Blastococcus aurantiacus]
MVGRARADHRRQPGQPGPVGVVRPRPHLNRDRRPLAVHDGAGDARVHPAGHRPVRRRHPAPSPAPAATPCASSWRTRWTPRSWPAASSCGVRLARNRLRQDAPLIISAQGAGTVPSPAGRGSPTTATRSAGCPRTPRSTRVGECSSGRPDGGRRHHGFIVSTGDGSAAWKRVVLEIASPHSPGGHLPAAAMPSTESRPGTHPCDGLCAAGALAVRAPGEPPPASLARLPRVSASAPRPPRAATSFLCGVPRRSPRAWCRFRAGMGSSPRPARALEHPLRRRRQPRTSPAVCHDRRRVGRSTWPGTVADVAGRRSASVAFPAARIRWRHAPDLQDAWHG